MKKILLLIFLLNVLSFAQVNFSKITLDKAELRAKSENKKILVDFYTNWCVPCKELDKYIFEDLTISKYINANYISLQINAESDYGRKIGRELNLQEAYPTVMFITPDGKEIDRIVGLIYTPNKYLQKIKDYTKNINTFSKLLEKEKSDNSDSLKYQIAIKYFERGKFGIAIQYYKYLVNSSKFNSNGMIYFNIGRCYSFVNNNNMAQEFIKKAIDKNPSQKQYKEFFDKLNKK